MRLTTTTESLQNGREMEELSKGLKRELRELKGVGWERSLAAGLGELEKQFARWRAGEIDAFELNNLIHVFHNGAARDLYNYFTFRGMDSVTVSALIVDGVLAESEISPELGKELAPEIEHIREFRAEEE